MPEFGNLAFDPEGAVDDLFLGRLVGDEINFRVAGAAVNEAEVFIRAHEVRCDAQGVGQRPPPKHPALPVPVFGDAAAVAISPDLSGEGLQGGIRSRVVGQARRPSRTGADDRGARLHKVPDLFQDRHGHAIGVRQHQHAIGHAARQDKPPVLDRHPQQYFGVADIVVEAARQLGGEQGRPHVHGRALAVIIAHVGGKMPLLQQVLAAGQI